MQFPDDRAFIADANLLFKTLSNGTLSNGNRSAQILSWIAYKAYKQEKKKIVLSVFYDNYAERLLKFNFMGDADLFFEAHLTTALLSKCETDPRVDWNNQAFSIDCEREYLLNLYWIDNLNSQAMLNNVPTYKKIGKVSLILTDLQRKKIREEIRASNKLLKEKKIMTQTKKIA